MENSMIEKEPGKRTGEPKHPPATSDTLIQGGLQPHPWPFLGKKIGSTSGKTAAI
jgi:hypothetical protein